VKAVIKLHKCSSAHRKRTPKQKAWRGDYCCVPLCRNSSGQNKERQRLGLPKLSFHVFPKAGTIRYKNWIVKIRRDPGSKFVINKYTKICSQHFTAEDFSSKERRRLKPDTVPSIFPWTNECFRRDSETSRIAKSDKQRCDFMEERRSSESTSCSDFGGDSMEDTFKQDDYEYLDSATTKSATETEALKSHIIDLQSQILKLQQSIAEVELSAQKSLFRLQNIKDNDDLIRFYTGFPDYSTLIAAYKILLESDASVMQQWNGKHCKEDFSECSKQGRRCKLPLVEQFFLTLVRLRLGLLELDLANRFGVSQSTVSRITTTWINLMYHTFKGIEVFPSWHIVKKYMPTIFKDYPNTRIIIDATEFRLERPSSLLSQSCTFSKYKNTNTVKVLIGVTPSGAISFVSPCYEGSISDRRLVEVSGLLEMLEPGDEVMADKGFQIQDILAPLGVRLNTPPFLTSNSQMPVDDVVLTSKIARLRIHVERAIGRIKEYHILQNVLPAAIWDTINQVVYVCCMLANFNPPLVS